MTIETVFIQCDDEGEYPNSALFNAAQGFETRGRDVVAVTTSELGALIPRKEDLVFGGVDFVLPYLERLGCKPEPLDYPATLHPFMGSSQVATSTLGEIRKKYRKKGDPLFIKPINHKEFTGCMISRRIDITHLNHLEGDTRIFTRPPVEMLSEWRFYVEEGKVVGVDHYKGNPLLFPNRFTVENMVRAISGELPVCFSLDVARTDDDMPMPIEVNDMICLGSYGLDPCIYARMIEKRWNELVGFEE